MDTGKTVSVSGGRERGRNEALSNNEHARDGKDEIPEGGRVHKRGVELELGIELENMETWKGRQQKPGCLIG